MQMTQELRAALLDGNQFGFVEVNAPKWAGDRIAEVRHALAEKREVPAPSREYVQAAETRSAILQKAGRFVRNLLPARRNAKSIEEKFFERNGYWPSTVIDGNLRLKAARQAAEIRKDAILQARRGPNAIEALESLCGMTPLVWEKPSEEIRAEKSRPDTYMTADQREQHQRKLDVAAGLREPERFPWEIA
jgi:hypothetical protein